MYKTDTKRKLCLNCFEEIDKTETLFEILFSKDVLCPKCRSLLKRNRETFYIEGIAINALYVYNDTASQFMMQIKEAHDQTLACVFINPFINRIRKSFKDKTIVCVPSFIHKTEERGYHALKEMFKPCALNIKDVLVKDDVKQSHGNRKKRKEIQTHIHIKENLSQLGPIVLIDDICTTGESLKACIQALKPYVSSIEIQVLCIHEMWCHNKFQD